MFVVKEYLKYLTKLIQTHTHTNINLHQLQGYKQAVYNIYTYVYIFTCVCVLYGRISACSHQHLLLTHTSTQTHISFFWYLHFVNIYIAIVTVSFVMLVPVTPLAPAAAAVESRAYVCVSMCVCKYVCPHKYSHSLMPWRPYLLLLVLPLFYKRVDCVALEKCLTCVLWGGVGGWGNHIFSNLIYFLLSRLRCIFIWGFVEAGHRLHANVLFLKLKRACNIYVCV